MPVDTFISLMNDGHLTIAEQPENAFKFWNDVFDLAHHPDCASGLIDFSDITEKQACYIWTPVQ